MSRNISLARDLNCFMIKTFTASEHVESHQATIKPSTVTQQLLAVS